MAPIPAPAIVPGTAPIPPAIDPYPAPTNIPSGTTAPRFFIPSLYVKNCCVNNSAVGFAI
jgi:hypothetical protein